MRTHVFALFAAILVPSLGLCEAPGQSKFRWAADRFKVIDLNKKLVVGAFEQNGSELPVESVNLSILAMRDSVVPAGNEIVGRSAQYVGAARVVGTWIQTVFSKTGQVLYATGEVVRNPPHALALQAAYLQNNLASAEHILKERMPAAKDAAEILPPRVEILWDTKRNTYQPHWYVEFVASGEASLRYARITPQGEVLAEGETTVSGADGLARVFPKGPRLSDLSEERLHGLVGDGSLSSAVIKLSSALNLNLWSPEQVFVFDVMQPQFEAVQAYYSVDRALAWFRSRLGVELRNPLQVRTHVGEGGVSNAAFYHDNRIYLGTGDGVLYRDMLKDPTVVMHETAHAIIDHCAALPATGEGGSLNEGFADFFTALMLDHPHMGEVSWVKGPYRRTLKHDLKAYRDFGPGVYRNGSIVAATFWDIRERLGTEKAAQVAFRTLVRLGSGSGFDDFVPAVVAGAAGVLSPADTNVVTTILAARGWRTVDGL